MSLIPFSKEQFPKLDDAQLEAIHQRISVRAVAGSNILMAAERSFPHVTLDDALLESLQEHPASQGTASPKTEAVSAPAPVRQLRPESQHAITPVVLENTQSREAIARETIAVIFGQHTIEADETNTMEEAA